MPTERIPGKPSTRRYTPAEKEQAVRLVRGVGEAHRLDERLNQRRCLGADDVGAEEEAGPRVGENLHEPGGVLERQPCAVSR